MRITALLMTIAITASISNQANASLIDHGSYFTDTSTGLDWLNNTPLAGQSFDSVLAGVGGYTTSGWRFATASDLENLVDNYVGLGNLGLGLDATYFNYAPAAQGPAIDLISLLGINVSFGDPPDARATAPIPSTSITGIVTQGWYDDGTGGPLVGVFDLAAYYIPSSSNPYQVMTQIIPDYNHANDFHGPNISAILVRDSTQTIVEPNILVLFISGLMFLVMIKRRRPVFSHR